MKKKMIWSEFVADVQAESNSIFMVAPTQVGSDGAYQAVVVVGSLDAPEWPVLEQVSDTVVVFGHVSFQQEISDAAQTLLESDAHTGEFGLHEFSIGEACKGYLMFGIDTVAISSKHVVFPYRYISAEDHSAEDNGLHVEGMGQRESDAPQS